LSRTVVGYYKDKEGKTRPITQRKGKSSYHGQSVESSWKESSMRDIKTSVKDEHHDAKKYDKLAQQAPTKKERKALKNIARDERRHGKTLKKIDPPQEKWMGKAFAGSKGQLHRQLDIPEDQKIPKSYLKKIKETPIGKTAENPTKTGKRSIKVTRQLKQRATLAHTAREVQR
jgi:rubrerythrin